MKRSSVNFSALKTQHPVTHRANMSYVLNRSVANHFTFKYHSEPSSPTAV